MCRPGGRRGARACPPRARPAPPRHDARHPARGRPDAAEIGNESGIGRCSLDEKWNALAPAFAAARSAACERADDVTDGADGVTDGTRRSDHGAHPAVQSRRHGRDHLEIEIVPRIDRSGANVVVSWPSPSTGFSLQQNTNLNTTNWTSVVEPVNDNGTVKSVILAPPFGNRFFRLIAP